MRLRARAWVRFDWQNDWGVDQVSDCASVITLDSTSVITLAQIVLAQRLLVSTGIVHERPMRRLKDLSSRTIPIARGLCAQNRHISTSIFISTRCCYVLLLLVLLRFVLDSSLPGYYAPHHGTSFASYHLGYQTLDNWTCCRRRTKCQVMRLHSIPDVSHCHLLSHPPHRR